MRLRVLDCGGSVGPGSRPASFLLGEDVILDMGAAASTLSLPEQRALRHVLITHGHLDHVKDLAFVCENVFGQATGQLRVYGTAPTLKHLREHLLNDEIWPDFSRRPPGSPLIRYHELTFEKHFRIGELGVLPIEVSHSDGAAGFLLDSERGLVAVSGDTGPTELFWREVGQRANRVRAVLVECSFPDRLEQLALASGHLCPRLLRWELAKLGEVDVPIHVYSLKIQSQEETVADLAGLRDDRVQLLRPGMGIEF